MARETIPVDRAAEAVSEVFEGDSDRLMQGSGGLRRSALPA